MVIVTFTIVIVIIDKLGSSSTIFGDILFIFLAVFEAKMLLYLESYFVLMVFTRNHLSMLYVTNIGTTIIK